MENVHETICLLNSHGSPGERIQGPRILAETEAERGSRASQSFSRQGACFPAQLQTRLQWDPQAPFHLFTVILYQLRCVMFFFLGFSRCSRSGSCTPTELQPRAVAAPLLPLALAPALRQQLLCRAAGLLLLRGLGSSLENPTFQQTKSLQGELGTVSSGRREMRITFFRRACSVAGKCY